MWYLIEKVLLQRPHLEAGKRVTEAWYTDVVLVLGFAKVLGICFFHIAILLRYVKNEEEIAFLWMYLDVTSRIRWSMIDKYLIESMAIFCLKIEIKKSTILKFAMTHALVLNNNTRPSSVHTVYLSCAYVRLGSLLMLLRYHFLIGFITCLNRPALTLGIVEIKTAMRSVPW